MRFEQLFLAATSRLTRRRRDIESFADALRRAGELVGRSDAGHDTVPVDRIVGSVGRAQNLRHDFLPRTGPRLTARHHRIANAMRDGQRLPAVELYRLTVRPAEGLPPSPGEYYVLDGHHRVAMARRLGQAFLDAHVVEYRVVQPCDGGTGGAGSSLGAYSIDRDQRNSRRALHRRRSGRQAPSHYELKGSDTLNARDHGAYHRQPVHHHRDQSARHANRTTPRVDIARSRTPLTR